MRGQQHRRPAGTWTKGIVEEAARDLQKETSDLVGDLANSRRSYTLAPLGHDETLRQPCFETDGRTALENTGPLMEAGGRNSLKTKCTSRPDCPCDFCVRVRAIAEGRSERDTQDRSALLVSHLRTGQLYRKLCLRSVTGWLLWHRLCETALKIIQ